MADVMETDWAAEIRALGGEGLGRAEIAARLGLSLARLAGWEASDPAIAAAMAVADAAARAWWAARQREALLAGARMNASAWREAMAWRFGAPGKGGPGAIAAPPRATFLIPCNGSTRLLPDGTCPCAGVHDADWWRRTARLRAWVVAGNDQRDFDDDEDEWESGGDDETQGDETEGDETEGDETNWDEGDAGAADVDSPETER
jgi:hypothetical protein